MNLKRLAGMHALGGICQFVGGADRIALVHGNSDDTSAHRGPIALGRQDVGHGHVLKNLHVVQLADSLEQLGRDLLARNVGMEGDARAAVRASRVKSRPPSPLRSKSTPIASRSLMTERSSGS